MWKDNREKIRRFLRDPDGNIWTDGFLLRAFNDSQVDFNKTVGFLESVEALRVPPMYQMSYLFEWEWRYVDHDGKEYKALKYHQQSPGYSCSFKWETQQLGLTTGSETEEGTAFIHPFEGFMVTNANSPIPIWFPYDFSTVKFIAWDKEPIDFITKKEIESIDSSWKTNSGTPEYYYREDISSNELYLYPKPSSPNWGDIEGDANDGQVLFTDDFSPDAEVGTIIDVVGSSDNENNGVATDVIENEDNVLLVYEGQPTDIQDRDSESDYPRFLQKYIEHATLEQAYSANTDGRIGSLKDYWQWRKELGSGLVKKFKWKRFADRDLRLVSKDGGYRSSRRGPRLPAEYPNI